LREEIRREIEVDEELSMDGIRELLQSHLEFTDLITRYGLEEAYDDWKEKPETDRKSRRKWNSSEK
jgi:hypothetical protein